MEVTHPTCNRRRLWSDWNILPEDRSRAVGLRSYIPHGGDFRTSRARAFLAGGGRGEAAGLGASVRGISIRGGLAGLRLLSRIDGCLPRSEGYSDSTRC